MNAQIHRVGWLHLDCSQRTAGRHGVPVFSNFYNPPRRDAVPIHPCTVDALSTATASAAAGATVVSDIGSTRQICQLPPMSTLAARNLHVGNWSPGGAVFDVTKAAGTTYVVILIVEDEHFIAMGLTWQLEDAGHTILGPASNLETVRTLAGERRADLALVDIHLQGHADGLAVARYLKMELQVPTLFMTGQPRAARQHADLAIGVITKPCSCSDAQRGLMAAEVVINGAWPSLSAVPDSLELFCPMRPAAL